MLSPTPNADLLAGNTKTVETNAVCWVCGSCALKAHEIQLPEMAAAAKPNQQPCTKSCVVSGNGNCEA